MGSEIVYCDSCGERILEKEIQQGKALTIQNKNFCSNCKEQAITDHSGEMNRDEFAKSVLPKEEPPAQEKKNSTTSHMRAVRSDQKIVSRAGQPTRRHHPGGPSSRIHGRAADGREKGMGRDKVAGRYGRPTPSSASSSSTIWVIAAVVAAILIVVLLLAIRK